MTLLAGADLRVCAISHLGLLNLFCVTWCLKKNNNKEIWAKNKYFLSKWANVWWLMSPGTWGLFKDLTSVFAWKETQKEENKKDTRRLVFSHAFWSLASRWHEKLRSVHWTEDQRCVPSLLPPSDPEPSQLSSVCFSTCSFDSPVYTSVSALAVAGATPPVPRLRCCSIKSRTDRLSRANGWELVWNKILFFLPLMAD